MAKKDFTCGGGLHTDGAALRIAFSLLEGWKVLVFFSPVLVSMECSHQLQPWRSSRKRGQVCHDHRSLIVSPMVCKRNGPKEELDAEDMGLTIGGSNSAFAGWVLH